MCVELGIEYISRDTVAQGDREAIILGDGSIFAEDTTITEDRVFEVDQATRFCRSGVPLSWNPPEDEAWQDRHPTRGTRSSRRILEQRVYNRKEQKGCIMLQPDTIVLAPKAAPTSSRYSSICRKRH